VALRDAVKSIYVNVLGMAQSGLVINAVVDVASGEENTRLAPGGGVNLAGSKIRIAGDNPACGILLTEQNSGAETPIPPTAILANDPSKVTFIVPTDLPAGDYKLSLTTQFSATAQLLKEPRTYIFDYVLTV
jgi:hypothetical protein